MLERRALQRTYGERGLDILNVRSTYRFCRFVLNVVRGAVNACMRAGDSEQSYPRCASRRCASRTESRRMATRSGIDVQLRFFNAVEFLA